MKTKHLLLAVITCLLVACQSDDNGNTNGGQEPSPSGQNDPKERVDISLTRSEQLMANSANDFSFDLFKQVCNSNTTGENIFISPLSASLCLSMTANGADNNTLAQMKSVLGFSSQTVGEVNDFNRKLLTALLDLDNMVQLDIANSIWIKQGFVVKDKFTEVNKQMYDATVQNLDFDSPLAVKTINDWCAEKTQNRLTDILQTIPPQARLILANALYFKGKWALPFDKELTADETFRNSDGTDSKISMMNQNNVFPYLKNNYFSIAEFPYGNEAFSMVVFLPSENKTIAESLEQFSNEAWQNWNSNMHQNPLKVKMPKFTFKYNRKLENDLQSLGMTDAFNAANADFKNISETEDLYIGLLTQFTFVEVNEAGTEGAGITIEIPVISPSPDDEVVQTPEFNLDRPFMFMIKEKSTGVILFMGMINKL